MKNNNNVTDITEGSIVRSLLSFFYPILLGTFFQQLYNTGDAFIIGRYVGKQALAAVSGSCSTLMNLMLGFFIGLSAGATVLISQAKGAGDDHTIRHGISVSIRLSIMIGVIFTVIGVSLTKWMLIISRVPYDTMMDSEIYLKTIFMGISAAILYNMLAGILRALGDSKTPFYFLVMGTVINIFLDVAFVVWFKMGVRGAAYATVISQVITAVGLFYVLGKQGYLKKLYKFNFGRGERKLLANILYIGFPAGMQSVMYNISNLMIQTGMNSFGTDAVAAWGIYGKVDGIFWMTMSALGISITTFVGQNYGAGKLDRVKKGTRVCLGLAAGITLALSVLLFIFSKELMMIFTGDAEVISIGNAMIRYLAPVYFTYICIEILSGSVRGMGHTFYPTLITFVGVCVLRIAWIAFALPVYNNVDTVMFSYPLTWTTTSIAFVWYYRHLMKRKMTFVTGGSYEEH